MKSSFRSILAIVAYWLWCAEAVYVPLREYAGQTFFDGWDYYGMVDNTTWGNVTYLDQADGMSRKLTYVNTAGNAIIKVDNSTNIANTPLVHRDSIRLTTKDTYGIGTLWIIDSVHMPYGCSVWPSFWSLGVGKKWPLAGEIDVIEAINLMNNNQVALHTTPGCVQAHTTTQSGTTMQEDCSLDEGCIVAENKPNSYGAGFAQAGGGVYALQLDVSGIFVWFWSRPDVPGPIKTATSTSTMDVSAWGPPSASFPASGCNITEFFAPQQLILLISLCGVWAGVPSIYSNTCHTATGSCVADNIIGPGSTYDNAYFEIRYLRTYIADYLAPAHSSSLSATSQQTVSLSDITSIAAARSTSVASTSSATRLVNKFSSGPILTITWVFVYLWLSFP